MRTANTAASSGVRYTHFRRVVPWVWTLQGRKHTWFAGSWTLFNTHDIAIASGLCAPAHECEARAQQLTGPRARARSAAAHRLGAPYPFGANPLAAATFDTVLGTSHLRWRGSDKVGQAKSHSKTA